jgi:hypothetical protein
MTKSEGQMSEARCQKSEVGNQLRCRELDERGERRAMGELRKSHVGCCVLGFWFP